MIALHAIWASTSELRIWGESSLPSVAKKGGRRAPQAHPFACNHKQLLEGIDELTSASSVSSKVDLTLILPSAKDAPSPSPHVFREPDARQAKGLNRWRVPALAFNIGSSVDLLLSLPETNPPGIVVGDSLRFFCIAARLALEFVARGKARPALVKRDDRYLARWMVSADNQEDAERLRLLAEAMPALCRAESVEDSLEGRATGAVLTDFIENTVDQLARASLGKLPLLAGRRKKNLLASEAWLTALTTEDATVEGEGDELSKLQREIAEWAREAAGSGDRTLRTCFRLSSPEEIVQNKSSKKKSDPDQWQLEFMLQAIDDRSLLVPADMVWKTKGKALTFSSRKLENPQERLLEDLGRAMRLYPDIERALRAAKPVSLDMDVNGAYRFLRESAPMLEQAGFGVLMPAWWTRPTTRLGVKLKAAPGKSTSAESSGLLGMDGLVDYKWEIALGDEELSFDDFMKLANLKKPLVKARGQWIELKPEEIEAALAFFKKREATGRMTTGEALRMGMGLDSSQLGLPVTAIEASGWLGDLMKSNGERKLKPIKTPKNFSGKLRPYQERGLSWLAFLGGLGLGACLADDMGLGKCVSNKTLIAINGILQKAEDVWNHYAGPSMFDGEGYWADPIERLLTNSIDEKTGKIVQTRIRRLYRQRVHEPLRTIKLEDGSSVTITRRHKLMTKEGWTNDLNVGDYVCVPAKMAWEGKAEDPDMVKFLAWQIAEGYELQDQNKVKITQKDVSALEDLLGCIRRIGEKYEIKINHPSIHIRDGRVADLTLCSVEYRRFLEAKGYDFGKLSREKSIPPFIMQADLDTTRLFLSNYFDAEASVTERMRSIEISSASPLLIEQLSYMLRRLGIWMRISSKKRCATNGTGIFRDYYFGIMGGNAARKFCKEIGFSNPEKQARLERICEKPSNTNVEGIPASEIVARTIAETKLPLRHFGMHSTVYIDGSQQFSRASLERVLASYDDIISSESERRYASLKTSKWTSQTLEAYAHLDRQYLSSTRGHLQSLLDQEVYYCKIKGIENIDYDGWVYDFEIEEHHNFVANNILCHNTIQLLALLVAERQKTNGKKSSKPAPTLLVCPMSVVGNWQREAERFAPALKIHVHHGAERLSGKRFAGAVKKSDLVITTYALAARDQSLLEKTDWARIALDEAQNIKNPSAKQTQAIRSLKAAQRVALTGTPVENRLSELWSIMQFLNPGLLGSAGDFKSAFAVPIERYKDEEKARLLKRLTGPFILRRLKTDKRIIKDLPDKIEMKIFCNLTKEQGSLYQAVVEEMLDKVEASEGIERKGVVLATMMKLKQVCNHPVHLLKDESSLEGRSGKLARLEEILEEVIAEGDRALCFTQFTEMGSMLQSHLQERFGREALFLHGGTTRKARDLMVKRFQEEGGPQIFLLSLKAGGTGLNLTAAQHVIHFDRWWNPAVEEQATDRAFRIGQTRNVQVRKFVCVGTIEERIDLMIEQKKALAERIVGTGESWVTELSTAQIRELVQLSSDAVSES